MEAEVLRRIQKGEIDVSYEIVKKCLDKFFFDLLMYCYDFDKREVITIDCNYLPYHLISKELLQQIVTYLEGNLGYAILIQKVTNTNIPGYKKGDMIHINLYNKEIDPKELDKELLMHEQRTIYSTFHKYSEIHGTDEAIQAENRVEYTLLGNSIKQLGATI